MIYGFMHVALMNHGYEIFKEQVYKIIQSKLYNVTDNIFVYVLGSSNYDFSNLPSKFIVQHKNELEVGELWAIESLKAFSDNEKAFVWYLHTKGASRPNNYHCQLWRRYMEYFLIVKHKQCIDYLATYDICGVEWYDKSCSIFKSIYNKECPYNHFSGNFWWANTDYIKTLKSPPKYRRIQDRMYAEEFIGSNNPKYKNIRSLHKNLYKEMPSLSQMENIKWV